MDLKFSKTNFKIFLMSFLLIGNILLIPNTLKAAIFNPTAVYINVFWLLGLLFVILNPFNLFLTNKRKKNILIKILFILTLLFSYSIFGQYFSNSDMIKRFLTMNFPVLILFYNFKSKDNFKIFLKYSLFFFNIAALIIALSGVIDLLTSRAVSYFFMSTFSDYTSLPDQYSMSRTISYYGHPLYTSQLLLIYLSLNEIKARILKKQTTIYFHYVVCALGLSFTSSKAAMLTFLAYVVLSNFTKFKKLIPIFIIIIIGYFQGFFSNVISRLQDDIAKGNITSNRNSSLALLINTNQLNFNFFRGTSNFVPNDPIFIAALEYPPLHLAYTHGAFYVLTLYTGLIFYPIYIFFKEKHLSWFLLINFSAITVFVNTFNGLSNGRDNFMLFVTYTFILINASKYLKMEG